MPWQWRDGEALNSATPCGKLLLQYPVSSLKTIDISLSFIDPRFLSLVQALGLSPLTCTTNGPFAVAPALFRPTDITDVDCAPTAFGRRLLWRGNARSTGTGIIVTRSRHLITSKLIKGRSDVDSAAGEYVSSAVELAEEWNPANMILFRRMAGK